MGAMARSISFQEELRWQHLTSYHVMFVIAFPGSLYLGTMFCGFGYSSIWSIVPAIASEIFGLKSFGVLYNILSMANPAKSMLLSRVIAGSIYDREAEPEASRF